ncbi:hypothetical protein QFC20_007599 [Naganishia adeliensis]|uniref:Uncharacterized protein n=1 Tax=Naganishia adeliensis TaxID=92952 RepID=A0ACC2UX03_9TREE|nr:hypothetical protein QFC20_007599 [Naganishia adeliensis]
MARKFATTVTLTLEKASPGSSLSSQNVKLTFLDDRERLLLRRKPLPALWVGFDLTQRDPLTLPAYTVNAKDGSIQCKKHSNSNCSTCFGWKKQLSKLHKDGVKKSKSKKDSGSNLFV